ncbi:unnamed protein product [Caenorhabditis auriculariae]|uniref:Protein SYS1 homolog n=1 Tax=Caenorhabditis auriculariae TaxID=2777116 RepID=A0A8S1HYN9_9PELO|nr:unnamed protein product [Caenorhabditis auriculariae]
MSSFRSFVWDPMLLISQMVCIQSIFYMTVTFLLILYSFFGYDPVLSTIFSNQASRLMAMCQVAGSLVCAFALSVVVQRAKQCLDFACTLHFFHLLIVVAFNLSFPFQLSWWLLQILSCIVCTVGGEFLCMRAESQEIKLEGGPSKYDL